MKPLAIGTMVDVPTLHTWAGYGYDSLKEWFGRQRGRVIEAVESGDRDNPDDPLVCLEIVGEDRTLYAWFLASDIRAGTISDPDFSLSVDAMVSEHRPEISDEPNWIRKYVGDVRIFFPEDETWHSWKRYRVPPAD